MLAQQAPALDAECAAPRDNPPTLLTAISQCAARLRPSTPLFMSTLLARTRAEPAIDHELVARSNPPTPSGSSRRSSQWEAFAPSQLRSAALRGGGVMGAHHSLLEVVRGAFEGLWSDPAFERCREALRRVLPTVDRLAREIREDAEAASRRSQVSKTLRAELLERSGRERSQSQARVPHPRRRGKALLPRGRPRPLRLTGSSTTCAVTPGRGL